MGCVCSNADARVSCTGWFWRDGATSNARTWRSNASPNICGVRLAAVGQTGSHRPRYRHPFPATVETNANGSVSSGAERVRWRTSPAPILIHTRKHEVRLVSGLIRHTSSEVGQQAGRLNGTRHSVRLRPSVMVLAQIVVQPSWDKSIPASASVKGFPRESTFTTSRSDPAPPSMPSDDHGGPRRRHEAWVGRLPSAFGAQATTKA